MIHVASGFKNLIRKTFLFALWSLICFWLNLLALNLIKSEIIVNPNEKIDSINDLNNCGIKGYFKKGSYSSDYILVSTNKFHCFYNLNFIFFEA